MSKNNQKACMFQGLALGLGLLMPLAALADRESVGAVYTMSNDVQGNTIVVFDRDKTGRLTDGGEFDTGGLGTGAGLGNSGAVILDPANRWLFVVNPGSNDLSVFAVTDDGLLLIDRQPSGGKRPVSLTYSRNLLYVLNAGGTVGTADNISGFRVEANGFLTPLAGSMRPLSAANTGPAQVSFNADGDVLLVTEKNTNLIDTYTVDDSGMPGSINSHASSGVRPFGFAMGLRDQVFVTETGGSAVSSYLLDEDGSLWPLSPSVASTEAGTCWVVVSKDGRFAYATNTGSGTISAFDIDFYGTIDLADAIAARISKNATPLDLAITNDGQNLYALDPTTKTVSAYQVKNTGRLSQLNTRLEVPSTASGLAAR